MIMFDYLTTKGVKTPQKWLYNMEAAPYYLYYLFICPHLGSGWGSKTSRSGWRWWRRWGRWSGTTRRSSWLRTARCPARGGTCVKVSTQCSMLPLWNLWLRRDGVGEGRMVTICTLFWEPCSFRSSGSWHTTLYLHNIYLLSILHL